MRLSPDPCPSEQPFTLIDDIQGRVEDVLSFPGAAGGVVNIHPLVFSRIMDTLPVSGWQVVQEADGLHVLLNGMRGPFGDEMLTATLQRALAEQGAIVPHMEVQQVDSIPKTAAGKAPLITSNLRRAAVPSSSAHDSRRVEEGRNAKGRALLLLSSRSLHETISPQKGLEMGKYYRGRRAQHYNARWRTYSERTLAETLAMIDVSALRSVSERLGRFPRLQETFDLITCTNALHDLVLFPSRDAPIIRPSMPNLSLFCQIGKRLW